MCSREARSTLLSRGSGSSRPVSNTLCGASMSRALQRRRMMAVCRFSLEGLEPRRLLSGLPGNPLNPTGSFPSWVVASPPAAAGIVAQPAVTPARTRPNQRPASPGPHHDRSGQWSSAHQVAELPGRYIQPGSQYLAGMVAGRERSTGSGQRDGTTTPLLDPTIQRSELRQPDDGTQMTIPLNQPLASGEYQIVLVGGS